jgi:hypothetical protein
LHAISSARERERERRRERERERANDAIKGDWINSRAHIMNNVNTDDMITARSSGNRNQLTAELSPVFPAVKYESR